VSKPARVRVYAHAGPFSSVAEAAVAERAVNWRAAEGEAHRACTVCFAASEVAVHLARIPGVDPELAELRAAVSPDPGIACVVLLTREDSALARGLPVSASRESRSEARCRLAVLSITPGPGALGT